MSVTPIAKVSGLLSVNIYIDCPSCDQSIDLFDVEYINDEAQLWEVIKRDRWTYDKDGWKDIGLDFQCPECKAELVFDTLEY